MWTRRGILKELTLAGLATGFCSLLKPTGLVWANAKRLLPKGFSREELKQLNPADLDFRNLDVDPLGQFGTMGPTEVTIDPKTYRLKVTGEVGRPLSLTYEQVLDSPSITEVVLLICPGFFSNNGRWTGVALKALLQEANVMKEAEYVDVKGANEKVVRIPLKGLDQKRIFLAHHVNGATLPQKHGFPLRLVYEDAYGYDWVKYVEELSVS